MDKKKVLIVEDQESIAELERDYLEINGFEVKIEVDGAAGLNTGLNENFDLIILDIMLPIMDGHLVCKELRKKIETPIIMVSAKKEDIDKIRALGIGADDYMTKPFSPQELVARVKSHISRYERLTSVASINLTEIKTRELTIIPESRRVYLLEEEVNLTNKEFDLLLFLASNPGIVFNKESLFEKIWGFDSYGDLATVTVHIRKLREKVEVDPSQPKFIETLWGTGYRFIK